MPRKKSTTQTQAEGIPVEITDEQVKQTAILLNSLPSAYQTADKLKHSVATSGKDEAGMRQMAKEGQTEALNGAFLTFLDEAERRNGEEPVRGNNIKAAVSFGVGSNLLAGCKLFKAFTAGSKNAAETRAALLTPAKA